MSLPFRTTCGLEVVSWLLRIEDEAALGPHILEQSYFEAMGYHYHITT